MKNKKKIKFKNLFKKLKKTNKAYKIIFFISIIIYTISVCLLTYSLILLDGIENLLRIIIIFILFFNIFILILFNLLCLISKKNKTLIFLLLLTLLFSGINTTGFYYINKTYTIVDDIKKDKIIYTTNYIALSKDIKVKTIGLLSKEDDIENFILPQEYIANNNIKAKINNYDTSEELLDALLNKEVDAIFIESNYILKYSDNPKYINLNTDTIILDTYSKKLDNQDSVASTNKSVTEPFTVLLLGVDSEYEGLSNNASFNGDSIMLVTFNPKTLSATLFSIPRDTYVPIACNNNKNNKINSAAGYGTKCMIDTIENLTDIEIDYYVKINFKGVVSLVNALDGITLDIDKPDFKYNGKINCGDKICEQDSNRKFGKDLIYITPGPNQNLNGEQALAYARNRHQFASSDFKRIEHQQAVVTAILNKAKTIRNINTFYKILNAISNNIDTNMETKEILNFYNVGKSILLNNNNTTLNIEKTYLNGYDLNVYQNGYSIYTFQYYEESLKAITKAMKENLNILKPTLIKEFSFSANKEYTVPVIGKTTSDTNKKTTMPNFIETSINELKTWANENNIELIITNKEANNCENDKILEQDIHSGTILNNINKLKVTVCKNIIETPSTEQPPIKEDTPVEENNENTSNNEETNNEDIGSNENQNTDETQKNEEETE